MEEEYKILNTSFDEIHTIRNDILIFMDILKKEINELKIIYSEFIDKNHDNNLFLFGLDALRFQKKMIDIEYDDVSRIFFMINNRMYCEYYKLYKFIFEFINNDKDKLRENNIFKAIKIDNSLPVYKDLEPYKQYDFNYIRTLNNKIINLIMNIHKYILLKQEELENYKSKNESGLNINNFVSAFNFNLVIVREKRDLFMSYIKYFHKMHLKYIKRFFVKVKLLYSQVNHDIKFSNNTMNSNDDFLLHDLKKNMLDIDSEEKSVNSRNTNTHETIYSTSFFEDEDENNEECKEKNSIIERIEFNIKKHESFKL